AERLYQGFNISTFFPFRCFSGSISASLNDGQSSTQGVSPGAGYHHQKGDCMNARFRSLLALALALGFLCTLSVQAQQPAAHNARHTPLATSSEAIPSLDVSTISQEYITAPGAVAAPMQPGVVAAAPMTRAAVSKRAAAAIESVVADRQLKVRNPSV